MDSRTTLRGCLAIVVAVACSSAHVAHAAPSAAQRETARRLMDEGKERTKSGDLKRALEAYQKAHELMKVPSTGILLAKAQVASGHLVEARDVALEVGRMPKEPNEPPIFEKARKEARELEAGLKPRIPTVKIIVKGGPATFVAVDDIEVGASLLGEPVAVNPGKHVVLAKNADAAEKRADFEVAERDAKEVDLVLPAPNPVTTPAVVEKAKIDSPEGDRGGQRTTTANVLLFGGFGLAAAGLAVGGITGALTLSKAGDVKSKCENDVCDPAAKGDLDSASSLATISTIGFAAAGVGAICGVVGLLLPKSKTETALQSGERRAAVWIGPGSMGVRGSF